MNIRKMIREGIKNLSEYEEISPEEFASLPSKAFRQKGPSQYSKEGALNANKKIAEVVAQYLRENPSETSTTFNSYAIEKYIHRKIPGFASIRALESLERKYRGLETYFGYLIQALGK